MILRPQRTATLFKTYAIHCSTLPDFLVPALCATSKLRFFSSTSRCSSRIGSAPLSLPTEVNLRVLEPPAQRRTAVTKAEQQRTVEVEGPLGTNPCSTTSLPSLTDVGTISFKIPPYMGIDHNQETRKVALNILNPKERKQREMWGRWTPTIKLGLR